MAHPLRALLHALRYPDRSVVIDLSCIEPRAKFEYIRSTLPALNVMRRRMGTPHRIVVDEGHYFLRDAVKHRLLDLDFNGYIVVTYWPSQLPQTLVTATEVILVTRESNRKEIDALRQHCHACQHVSPSSWDVLPSLRLDQAVALPATAEAGSELLPFTIGERLTLTSATVRSTSTFQLLMTVRSCFAGSRGDGGSRTHAPGVRCCAGEPRIGRCRRIPPPRRLLRLDFRCLRRPRSRARAERSRTGICSIEVGELASTRRGRHHVEVRALGGE